MIPETGISAGRCLFRIVPELLPVVGMAQGGLLDQVSGGQKVTVTYRGKPLARIVPYDSSPSDACDEPIFGMWKDRAGSRTVDEEVRDIRKGRRF